jgi:hypothetical protein
VSNKTPGPRFQKRTEMLTETLVTERSSPAVEGEVTDIPGPTPHLDPQDYLADLADMELTEEQAREFLETLWYIMGHFARAGFSSVDVCGLIFGEFNQAAGDGAGDVTLDHSTSTEMPSRHPGDGGDA